MNKEIGAFEIFLFCIKLWKAETITKLACHEERQYMSVRFLEAKAISNRSNSPRYSIHFIMTLAFSYSYANYISLNKLCLTSFRYKIVVKIRY